LTPDSFATGVDWLLERTVGTGTNGVTFGTHSFSDLDFANDVDFLAELHELLVPALETTASEAASLELGMYWQKTEVQALCSKEDEPSTITVQGQEVAAVKEFAYLGCIIYSTTQKLS